MRYLAVAVFFGVLIVVSACPQSQRATSPNNAEKYLLSVFPELPMISSPDLDTMDILPFSGNYPAGWPEEITVPANVLVLNNGEFIADPLGGNTHELHFVYKGDVGSLCQQLQSQGAQAGYTYEKPKWKGIPEDYRQDGIEWFVRLNPDDESKVFQYTGQVFPNNVYSYWVVAVSY